MARSPSGLFDIAFALNAKPAIQHARRSGSTFRSRQWRALSKCHSVYRVLSLLLFTLALPRAAPLSGVPLGATIRRLETHGVRPDIQTGLCIPSDANVIKISK